ncbi:YopX family protein [Enterocloster clostridioformis]|uniref:Phage uncharacterized protein TIGR01671 n=1 Tax=Enterocloster clostridioformis TaxID=1531 RepID=A0A1I0GKU7_9FIRM|nr:YopX family protein [Enterocloster clostridioformis]EHG33309.1 hypothetical protein HMPREF9467_00920 [ [[Clostridium] clostridioforme 2_1_49FAA]ENZ28577.1 hypothetical protein HMPREF1087_01068 [[Clostridium] clostridioforme 90A1]ENZ73494.1 hypothetical protein HMPREF1081_00105 [[Clostridium] clostridioforme 90A4]QIX89229.1 hypothetical protein FOC47_00695 [Enterocloster clostridioformis]SET71568.1 phage uncharacterized protein TIGR01671 [Enterocloster clostridioformis]
MDRYLCKAKRLDNAEWEKGYYVKCRGHHYILPVYDDDHGYDERYAEWIEIDPKTVCQYAGITDKNGREIWENDIIYHDAIKAVGKVMWYTEDYIGFAVDDIDDSYQQYTLEMFANADVVGNIFDNPDLLYPQN